MKINREVLATLILVSTAMITAVIIGLFVSGLPPFEVNNEIETTIHQPSKRIEFHLGNMFDLLGDVDDLNCNTRIQLQSDDNKTASDIIICKFDDGTNLKCQWNTFLDAGSINCNWTELNPEKYDL